MLRLSQHITSQWRRAWKVHCKWTFFFTERCVAQFAWWVRQAGQRNQRLRARGQNWKSRTRSKRDAALAHPVVLQPRVDYIFTNVFTCYFHLLPTRWGLLRNNSFLIGGEFYVTTTCCKVGTFTEHPHLADRVCKLCYGWYRLRMVGNDRNNAVGESSNTSMAILLLFHKAKKKPAKKVLIVTTKNNPW